MDKRAWILFALLILALGTMIMISAEITVSMKLSGDPSRAIVKISVKLLMGFFFFLIFSIFHYSIHEDLANLYYYISILSLIIVLLIPGKVHRWITLGPLSIQPSEISKILVIIFLAKYLKNKKEEIGKFKEGLLKPILIALLPAILVFLEPDLSTSTIYLAIAILMAYAAGAKLLHVLGVIGGGTLAIWGMIAGGLVKPYQLERLRSFFSNNLQEQVIMAMESAKSGGLLGKGVALGEMKLTVPVSQSDFIFSIIGEEFGYLGIAVILISYMGLVWGLIKLANDVVKDDFARFFIYGYTYLIILQVMVNLGVNVGVLPVTGITLPFISHGGSSYTAFMMGLGLCTSIFLSNEREEKT